MVTLDNIAFGSLNVPTTKGSYCSAQFTSLAFADILKGFEVRMYPSDMRTGKAVECSTQTESFDLTGWIVMGS